MPTPHKEQKKQRAVFTEDQTRSVSENAILRSNWRSSSRFFRRDRRRVEIAADETWSDKVVPEQLLVALNNCTALMKSQLQEKFRTNFQITMARYAFMVQLSSAPEGLSMSALAERLSVTSANVTWIASCLEKKGLVARTGVPHDRRMWTLKLTATGRVMFTKMATAYQSWLSEFFVGLSSSDYQQILELLAKISIDGERHTERSRR